MVIYNMKYDVLFDLYIYTPRMEDIDITVVYRGNSMMMMIPCFFREPNKSIDR